MVELANRSHQQQPTMILSVEVRESKGRSKGCGVSDRRFEIAFSDR